MHRTTPHQGVRQIQSAKSLLLETSEARTTQTTTKAAPCSRQSMSFNETGVEATLQMAPCQLFPAHSTLHKGKLSLAALNRATGTASTGLLVLPHTSQEDDHKGPSCGPSWVVKLIQGWHCPSYSCMKMAKAIHAYIAQTHHSRLHSSNTALAPVLHR